MIADASIVARPHGGRNTLRPHKGLPESRFKTLFSERHYGSFPAFT